MAAVICFSGSIGSGKTSVSRIVARKLESKRASFGDYVRHLVQESGGDPNSRTQLQDFGQSCVERDPREFCLGLLNFFAYEASEQLVVDGLRHGSVFKELVDILTPQPVYLLHLIVDPNVRANRIANRGVSTMQSEKAMTHKVESDVEGILSSMANQLIDANKPKKQVVADVLAAISRLSP